MVDEQFGIDAEELVEKTLVIILVRLPDGAARDVAHRIQPVLLQLFRVAAAHAPEVRQRTVLPKQRAVAPLVKLRDAHAVLVRRNALGHHVHGHLAEIEVAADARRRRDARRVQHVEDHGPRQLASGRAVGLQIAGNVHQHLVDGVGVDILGRDVLEIDAVDLHTDLDVFRHARRRHQIVDREGRVGLQREVVRALSGQPPARRAALPFGVDLPHTLDHLKEPRTARDAVGLQCRRHREADGLFRAARVCHHKVRLHRVQAALHALHGRVIRLEINGDIGPLVLRHGAALPSVGQYTTTLELEQEFYSIIFGAESIVQRVRASSSSTSSPNMASAASTGAGVLISTPASFRSEIGSVLLPPERKRL